MGVRGRYGVMWRCTWLWSGHRWIIILLLLVRLRLRLRLWLWLWLVGLGPRGRLRLLSG